MATACASNELTVEKKLHDIFQDAVNKLDEIEKSNLPFNSTEYQRNVQECIEHFEDSTRLVSLTGMFSTNEAISEIPTEYLQYLLLPFYLGQLSIKLLKAEREDALKTSQIYYKDFLKRCEDYQLIKQSDNSENVELDENNTARTDDDKMRDLLRSANERNLKIKQYREMKELEQQIEKLKLIGQQPHVDDEIKRELYLKSINYSILKSKEEITSLVQELQILEFRKHQINSVTTENIHNSASGSNIRNNINHIHQTTKLPLKPVIITRDAAQKQIFGMGYPSLPVMTVSEFYEERVASGIFPNAAQVAQLNKEMLIRQTEHNNGNNDGDDKEEVEKIIQEQLEENDDHENLERLRARDEYKDVVRRGDGNRHNRS